LLYSHVSRGQTKGFVGTDLISESCFYTGSTFFDQETSLITERKKERKRVKKGGNSVKRR
jgi:hypothetical protein